MHRFIAPSASPKAIATRTGWSRTRGRHQRDEDDGGEREAAERRARRPELVEQLDREGRPRPAGRWRRGGRGRRARFRALCGTAAPSAARRSTPAPWPRRRPPAGRLVEPARALVALLGPQRRLGAAGSRAAPPRPPPAARGPRRSPTRAGACRGARSRTRPAATKPTTPDSSSATISPPREGRRAHRRQRLLAREAPGGAAGGEEELGHGVVVGRLSRAHARAVASPCFAPSSSRRSSVTAPPIAVGTPIASCE